MLTILFLYLEDHPPVCKMSHLIVQCAHCLLQGTNGQVISVMFQVLLFQLNSLLLCYGLASGL